MVIEDDPEMVELLQLLLRRRDIRLVAILTADEGLAAVEKWRPDLILLDLMMPRASGWDIYQHVQASPELCKIPIMILTVQPRRTAELNGQHFDAAAGYVTKPFRPQSLLAQVDRCLGTAGPSEVTPSV
jgi:DNA-binding response OmpR family regulator